MYIVPFDEGGGGCGKSITEETDRFEIIIWIYIYFLHKSMTPAEYCIVRSVSASVFYGGGYHFYLSLSLGPYRYELVVVVWPWRAIIGTRYPQRCRGARGLGRFNIEFLCKFIIMVI